MLVTASGFPQRELNAPAARPDKADMGLAAQDDPEISAEEARRRFIWARRQGRPAWLWPDVPVPAWREAMAQIASATAGVLAGAEQAPLQGDPTAIGLAGYTSGMGPLLGLWLERGQLQARPEVAAALARHLTHNRTRTARMRAAAVDLVDLLAEQGVETVVLKGAHTGAAHFPEAGVRPASDIDLLIRTSDMPAAEALLRRAGLSLKSRGRWESSWAQASGPSEPRSLTYVHADDPWTVDLHSSLNIAVGPTTPVAEFDLANPLASRGLWMANPRAGVLDQPLLLLHLAAHAGSGWQNLTLLRQVELVLVIRQDMAAGRLDWDVFLEVGAQTGGLAFAYPALRIAEALAPGIVPGAVLDRAAVHAPAAVRSALARLTPASAHRIDRNSLSEHFMWAPGWRGWLRQLASDLVPRTGSWARLLGLYEERAWRLIRGRVSQ